MFSFAVIFSKLLFLNLSAIPSLKFLPGIVIANESNHTTEEEGTFLLVAFM
jgi:hypothetical protein